MREYSDICGICASADVSAWPTLFKKHMMLEGILVLEIAFVIVKMIVHIVKP